MVRKKKVVEQSESEEEEQYHVEVITKARVNDEDGWDYYVKWANYDSEHNTWEPEENVQGCDRLLKGFWKDVGSDNKDYEAGHIVYATPTWIEREKKFFARNFGGSKSRESDRQSSQDESSDEIVEVPAKRPKKTSKSALQEPRKKRGRTRREPSPPQKKGNAKKKPTKAAPSEVSDSGGSMEDSDHAPLSKAKRPKKRVAESHDASAESSGDEPIVIRLPKLRGKASQTNHSKASAAEPHPKEPIPQPQQDDMAPLFSAPSSPDVALSVKELPPEPGPSKNQQLSRPPTMKAVPPKHQERRSVKALPLEIIEQEEPRGITTKMRLAQGAKKLTVPAKVSTSSSVQRNSLAKLSFKKITPGASSATSPVQISNPSAAQPNANARSTNSHMEIMTDVPHLVQSPVSMHDHLPSPEPSIHPGPSGSSGSMTRRPNILLPRHSVSSGRLSAEPMTEVDQFLSTVMPDAMAAPMDESAPEKRPGPSIPLAKSALTKPPVLGRILKKWKWTGELFIEVEAGRAQRLCNASLFDATDPRPSGLRFSICLTNADSLRLHKLHDVADLYMIARACTSVQQFAQLGPQEEEDADAINAFASHLRSRRAFTYARINLDDKEVALMLIFPSSILEICSSLKVPNDLRDANCVLAALVPWELTHREYEDAIWRRPRPTSPQHFSLDPAALAFLETKRQAFLRSATFHRAVRILKFPGKVLDFLASNDRPYCLWFTPADGTDVKPGIETISLRVILSACRARDVGHKADVRVIFIHVGALASFWKLPALAERRQKRPEIRYYTYGTHESISPERWGVREIFPSGGIVTFTPSAIIENFMDLHDLVHKIGEHPMWQCYILPSVVTMVAKLTCQDQSPLALYDQGQFLHDGLLDLIVQGKLALLRAPAPTCTADMKWIRWQLQLLSVMDARRLLQECIVTATEQYRNIQEADLPEAIQREIARDMWSLQMQPSIMDEFRRLVVVKTKSDRYFDVDKEGIESVSLTQFAFKDDYFQA